MNNVKNNRAQPVGAAAAPGGLCKCLVHKCRAAMGTTLRRARDSRGLTMQITIHSGPKQKDAFACVYVFFTNGHGPWEYFFFVFTFYYLYTPCGSFLFLFFLFRFFFSLYLVDPPRGWALHNTFLFFCLSLNPTHKFRGIFFYSFHLFFPGRKKWRDR